MDDAVEAFQQVVTINSEVDRDFKGEISRASESASDIKETIAGMGEAVKEAQKVLEKAKGVLDEVHRYFDELTGLLKSNQLPSDEAEAIAAKAEECATLIIAPHTLAEKLISRAGQIVSHLDEFDTEANETVAATTTAFDQIEELAGMIDVMTSN